MCLRENIFVVQEYKKKLTKVVPHSCNWNKNELKVSEHLVQNKVKVKMQIQIRKK